MRMINFHDLPTAHGSYVLHLSLTRPQLLNIGRLGHCHFSAGHYFYAGSACGAGGLRARVGRHLRGDGTPHWHIDHLRLVVEVRDVFYTVTDNQLECAWSQMLAQLPQAFIPVPHFGSSDCRSGCKAHLIRFPRRLRLTFVLEVLSALNNAPLVRIRC